MLGEEDDRAMQALARIDVPGPEPCRSTCSTMRHSTSALRFYISYGNRDQWTLVMPAQLMLTLYVSNCVLPEQFWSVQSMTAERKRRDGTSVASGVLESCWIRTSGDQTAGQRCLDAVRAAALTSAPGSTTMAVQF